MDLENASQPWLLIDDDAAFLSALSRRLSHRNFTVDTALDGFTALQRVKNQEYSNIVLDLNLTEESGLSLLPEIRSFQTTAKILILTGYASIATAVQAIKLGADQYLPKPATLQQILSALADTPEVSDNKSAESILVKSHEDYLTPEQLEWEHIQRTLHTHHGNVSATARALNMHRRTLQRKLNKKRG
ncbi:response regulator transcription factor [Pleionea litopenaei]|uniref:Response regulator n=1 Tax=Pleionea litopenaei TaxID=3070815 RepID=A0AA51RWP8_9GAMM|nr:response regulator [Pleionea sp. HL-JVS1]WMS88965.1 response regulator [Pleionea sp. HL-JVS1]